MKKKEMSAKGEVTIKRISFIIISILMLQMILPIIGNINILPNVYAANIYGNVDYTERNGRIYAEINDLNIESLSIETDFNGKKVTDFTINSASAGKKELKNLKNLKKLTIPVQFLTDALLNDYFVNANSIEEIIFIGRGTYDSESIVKTYRGIADLPNLKKITIGEGITGIEKSAFANCKSLQEVEFTSSQLKSTGDSSFAYCNELKNVTIKSSNLENIESKSFYSCEKLEKVRIETESLNTISYEAFKNCMNLLDFIVIYRNNIKYIGEGAFENCSRLDYYYDYGSAQMIGENIETIGERAFKNCGWLGCMGGGFPNNVPKLEYIGKEAFYHTAIKGINLKDSKLKAIPERAFANCRYLYSITFPDTLQKIETGAFANSNGGDNISSSGRPDRIILPPEINIPSSVTEIQDAAFARYNDGRITIPNTVKTIGENAFFAFNGEITCEKDSVADLYCAERQITHKTYNDNSYANINGFVYKLIGDKATLISYNGSSSNLKIHEKVILGDKEYKVTKIGENSLDSQRIDTIVLPQYIERIEEKALSNCKNLKRVFLEGGINYIADNAFEGSDNQYLTIYTKSNEYVETFATRNNITCKKLDPETNTYNIVEVVDNNNNVANSIKTTSTNSRNSSDKIAPSVSLTLSSKSVAAKSVDIKWTASDNSGIKSWKITRYSTESLENYNTYSGNPTQVSGTQTVYDNGTYFLYIKDTKGNYTCKEIKINNIDKTAPQISVEDLTSQERWNKAVVVTFIAKDSGVGIRYWKITKSNVETDGEYKDLGKNLTQIKETYTFNKNGTYYLWVKDDNGNSSMAQFNIYSVDESAPIINNFEKIYNNGSTYIKWEAYDYGVGVKSWKITSQEDKTNTGYENFPSIEKEQSNVYEFKQSGTYYLYVKDSKGNVTYKKFDILVDNSKPSILRTSVKKNDSSAEIQFSFADEGTGVKYWKISKNQNGSDGTYSKFKYNGEYCNLSSGTQTVTVTEDGTYYITLLDGAGFKTTSQPIYVDIAKPYIEKIEKISNTGKTYDGINYIKSGSKLTFKATFNEDVKNVDVSKIKLNGNSKVYSKIETQKIDDHTYNIIITGDKRDNQKISMSIEEGFLTDLDGNISNKSEKASFIEIITDSTEPKITYTYKNNKIITKMTDETGIAKYQWKILGDNNEVLWTGEMHDKLNKKSIDHSWTLKSYKDKKVTLYLEDVLGNKKTYTMEPDVRATVNLISKNNSTAQYKITTNVKTTIDRQKLKALSDDCKNMGLRILSFTPSGDTGKEYSLVVEISGISQSVTFNITKGAIYAYGTDDEREIEIPITVDVSSPVISIGNYEKNVKQKEIELSFYLIDNDSGIQQYEIYRDESLIKKKDVNSKGNYTDKTVIKKNGTWKLSVTDNQGNKTEKEIVIKNIDRTAPKINSIVYSKPDENGNIYVTITANEKVTIEGWTNISNQIKQKKYKEADLSGEGIKDTVNVVDEAGNETVVEIKDEIAPRIVGDIIKSNITDNLTDVKITFNEQVNLTEEQLNSGWSLSKDKKTINKRIAENTEITVTDLAGNEMESSINIDINGNQNGKLYTGKKKNEPNTTTKPTASFVKYIYLNRPIQSVDMQTLKNHVQYELIDNNKTLKITYYKRINGDHPIKFIENDEYSEYLTIGKVKNFTLKGDSNNDGTITNEDLEIMKNVVSGKITETDEFKKFAMDMNDDSKIDIEDMSSLMKMLSNN